MRNHPSLLFSLLLLLMNPVIQHCQFPSHFFHLKLVILSLFFKFLCFDIAAGRRACQCSLSLSRLWRGSTTLRRSLLPNVTPPRWRESMVSLLLLLLLMIRRKRRRRRHASIDTVKRGYRLFLTQREQSGSF